MKILDLRTLLTASLVLVSTSCASFQTDEPSEVLLEESQARFDYIDDRLADEPYEEDVYADDYYDDGEYIERGDSLIRQISLLAGIRNFSDDELWDRVDAETTLGLEYAQEIRNGLGFEIGGVGSIGTDNVSSNVDVTGAAAELYGGGRYFFRTDSRWLPYVGGGLSMILAGVDNDSGGQVADDQDFSLGLYLHGGVQYELTDFISLGLDLRTLQATKLSLETTTGDADYIQLGFLLGFRL